METFLIRALQLIMSLSLLVIIHEGGHFLFARLFKVRVEKFCLFFDPWFTLFKFKPKKSETEYAVGWLPLSPGAASQTLPLVRCRISCKNRQTLGLPLEPQHSIVTKQKTTASA